MRLINPQKNGSFSLFGALAVGKKNYLFEYFKDKHTMRWDLLDPETKDSF